MLSENIENSMNKRVSPLRKNDIILNTETIVRSRLKKRYRAEKRFQIMGIAAICVSLLFLFFLFYNIVSKGYSAFWQTEIQLDVHFDPADFPNGDVKNANYLGIMKRSIRVAFPDVTSRNDKRSLYGIFSSGAHYQLRELALEQGKPVIGTTRSIWFLASDDVDMVIKGHLKKITDKRQKGRLRITQIEWIDRLETENRIKKRFNRTFFTMGDSREPELSGILGATAGSVFTLLITLILSFPIGVAAALYLEEFAPKNRWTDIIEVNINNLAAVPSIVFGLLGLAVFLNFFGLPRSTPLVGGLVLTLMTLPTVIIAGRVSLKSVPPSIREAALGVGASKNQTVFHHVLPLALPGMLTGAIIGMARALGETAPLLMIGMVAFIVDIPGSIYDPSTVLPVQIYLWADSPERAFVERTSAAIMVLLFFLVAMNASAIFLRHKFERKW